jgi:dCTP deaminase
MILSAKAIQAEIALGRLRVDPTPDVTTGYDTDSVNVHMGDRLYEWRPRPQGMVTSLRLGGFKYRELERYALIELSPDGDGVITMRPGKFYQADLLEYLSLPENVCAHIEGKSSLARIGLQIHVTAPHAHAGWEGRLKLEMINHGPFNLEITPGFEIGQLFFYRIESPETGAVHRGQFQGQDGRLAAPPPA